MNWWQAIAFGVAVFLAGGALSLGLLRVCAWLSGHLRWCRICGKKAIRDFDICWECLQDQTCGDNDWPEDEPVEQEEEDEDEPVEQEEEDELEPA
jgi:hypothetical protein